MYTPHTSTALFGQVSAPAPTLGDAGESLRHDFKTVWMLRTIERRCEAMYAGDNERRTCTASTSSSSLSNKFDAAIVIKTPEKLRLY